MENNAEILEELTRQSNQLKTFPRQVSLTDQVLLYLLYSIFSNLLFLYLYYYLLFYCIRFYIVF